MLHIIYRSYGGENKKKRPHYYSKLLALKSLVRAVQVLKEPVEIIYLNDGPIPADRLDVMKRTGDVIQRSGLLLRGSLKVALALPVERRWHPEDIVWFAEDDYLYLPNALIDLVSAARICPEASYFGLYAQIGSKLPSGNPLEENRVPSDWRPSGPILVEGHPWFRALSTTSTFGGRVRVLMEDRKMMHVAMMTGGAWDHSICLMYQGFAPYTFSALNEWFHDARAKKRDLIYCTVGLAARIGLNGYQALRSIIGRTSNRMLISSDPALITHLETVHLATGTNWQAVAAETLQLMGD